MTIIGTKEGNSESCATTVFTKRNYLYKNKTGNNLAREILKYNFQFKKK